MKLLLTHFKSKYTRDTQPPGEGKATAGLGSNNTAPSISVANNTAHKKSSMLPRFHSYWSEPLCECHTGTL